MLALPVRLTAFFGVPVLHRPLLDHQHLSAPALQAIGQFHPAVVAEVQQAVSQKPLVVVGMAMNPFCRKARKALDSAGIAYAYMEYGSYLSQWKPRLAIKLWSGWPTYPQVFVRGQLLGGFEELHYALGDGSLKLMLGAQ